MPLCGFYVFPKRVGCNFASLENETNCLASSTLYLVLFQRWINSPIAVVFTSGWHSLMCIFVYPVLCRWTIIVLNKNVTFPLVILKASPHLCIVFT